MKTRFRGYFFALLLNQNFPALYFAKPEKFRTFAYPEWMCCHWMEFVKHEIFAFSAHYFYSSVYISPLLSY